MLKLLSFGADLTDLCGGADVRDQKATMLAMNRRLTKPTA